MNLLELSQEAVKIELLLVESLGEFGGELATLLEEIPKLLSQKVDSYEFIMKAMQNRAELYKQKAVEFQAASRTIEKYHEHMKEQIKYAMQILNTDELNGSMARFKLVKTQPKLIVEDHLLPDAYKQVITEIVPDKEKIKEALKDGVDVPGARLEETRALRTYTNLG